MHHSYEKGGLVIDNQPIPWNADAVVVECLARLPGLAVRRKEEFSLRIPGEDPVPLDNMRRQEPHDRFRLFFRLSPPKQTCNAEVIWRHHRICEVSLPVVGRDEFLGKLRLQHPTLAVRVASQTVSCQTFVSPQCRGLFAGAVLSSPSSLAPLEDLDFYVDWRRDGEAEGQQFPVRLSSSQLKGKHALLTVCPTGVQKKSGTWVASWKIDDEVLASQRIKAITKSQFLRSLRISETRLVLQTTKGEVKLARHMPAEGVARVGPCFLVSSSEVGMAGLCPLRVCATLTSGGQTPVLVEQELLVTDGPTPYVPGTLSLDEVGQVTAFELRSGSHSLGIMPLTAAPVAAFNAEGGFKAPPEYAWSSTAEDQLEEKLAKLLAPRANGR